MIRKHYFSQNIIPYMNKTIISYRRIVSIFNVNVGTVKDQERNYKRYFSWWLYRFQRSRILDIWYHIRYSQYHILKLIIESYVKKWLFWYQFSKKLIWKNCKQFFNHFQIFGISESVIQWVFTNYFLLNWYFTYNNYSDLIFLNEKGFSWYFFFLKMIEKCFFF